jgi:hypothetical protein
MTVQSWLSEDIKLDASDMPAGGFGVQFTSPTSIILSPNQTYIFSSCINNNTSVNSYYKYLILQLYGLLELNNLNNIIYLPVGLNYPNCGNLTLNNFSTTEHFLASQYLCNEGIIQPNQSLPPQTTNISRGDLANITYRGLIGQNNNTDAINFPCPFIDLQTSNTSTSEYYKHAKTLSYLEYGDGRSPFDRIQLNFNPNNTISKALVLKVLLEAWNIEENSATGTSPFTDVALSHPYFKYIKKAHELGIITGSGSSFSPDNNCTREDAFLMLYRMLNSSSITKPTLAKLNDYGLKVHRFDE